ncbi:MAG: thiamine phosphate synthase [Treponemataceae bacterium]|nr:thiamine phosphate synthase [Treponemataceae bacterium]
MKFDKAKIRESLALYALTDCRWTKRCGGKLDLDEQVELSIKGGSTMIQYREKALDENLSEAERAFYKDEAKSIQKVCEKHSVPFIINDDVELAMMLDADGIHVGQSDMALVEARKLLGPDKIIGVSAQTVEQAVEAEKNGADYLGVGAVFPTGSKDDAVDVPLEVLKKICDAVKIPVVAIGGISEQNVLELSGSGICGIAVISAIFAKDDIEKASRTLLEKVSSL